MIKKVTTFETATLNLIKAFAKKQDLDFEFSVDDDITDIQYLSDLYFNLSDIYFDMKTNQPKGRIIEWYYHRLDTDSKVNYKSYTMGAR